MNRIFRAFSLALSLALLGSFAILSSAPQQAAAAGTLTVGIYGATEASYLTDIQSKLNSTGFFSQVDIHEIGAYTPTLAELQGYQAVLVFCDDDFHNNTTMGDVLADYADAGGGVVVATFAFTSGWGVGGRILSGGYLPFTFNEQNEGTLLTLIPDLPAHPILAGVNSFDGGSNSYHDVVTLTAGATQVAHWSNDVPLVATKQKATGIKIVGLNFFPPSSDARSDFWNATTDGALLMGNSLGWAACIDNDNDTYGQGCAAGPDCDDTDVFYTDICQDCQVKVIPKTFGRLIGGQEKSRWLLIIGERGMDFGDNATIRWESNAIEVVKTHVFFKRFMLMQAKFNGEPLEMQDYRVLVNSCEGKITWAR